MIIRKSQTFKNTDELKRETKMTSDDLGLYSRYETACYLMATVFLLYHSEIEDWLDAHGMFHGELKYRSHIFSDKCDKYTIYMRRFMEGSGNYVTEDYENLEQCLNKFFCIDEKDNTDEQQFCYLCRCVIQIIHLFEDYQAEIDKLLTHFSCQRGGTKSYSIGMVRSFHPFVELLNLTYDKERMEEEYQILKEGLGKFFYITEQPPADIIDPYAKQ